MTAFRNTPTTVLADAVEATGDLIEAAQWMHSVSDFDPDELAGCRWRVRQMEHALESRGIDVQPRGGTHQRAHYEVQRGRHV